MDQCWGKLDNNRGGRWWARGCHVVIQHKIGGFNRVMKKFEGIILGRKVEMKLEE